MLVCCRWILYFWAARPGVVQATKKGASLRGGVPLRGGLKSSTCNITVFEVFRYLVERSFSSHKLRSSFSRRQWQLALCAPPSLRRLVFSDLGVPRSLGLPVAGDIARRRTRRRPARSTRRSCFSGRGPTPTASLDRVRLALGPLGIGALLRSGLATRPRGPWSDEVTQSRVSSRWKTTSCLVSGLGAPTVRYAPLACDGAIWSHLPGLHRRCWPKRRAAHGARHHKSEVSAALPSE